MSLLARVLWGLLALAVLALVSFVAIAGYGRVDGVEFSPNTFQLRAYSYWRVPLVRWQITPIHYDSLSSSLQSHLAMQKLLPASTGEEARWDLVFQKSSGSSDDAFGVGDAKILVDYVGIFGYQRDEKWYAWSVDHPNLAAAVWPVVAEMAQANLYIFVPDILELAEAADDADAFETVAADLLAEQFTQLGDTHRELGNHELAVSYYDQALEYDPSHERAMEGRAGCGDAADTTSIQNDD